ncbi:hypothetical protein N2152v2_007585 [Parachlorella kessleri]
MEGALASSATGLSDQAKGLLLALSSSIFIGSGGYSYLWEPLWWAGLLTMVVGEVANFAAYAFAPAILVTPLGALSIIVSAVLAHMLLNERLNVFGVLGCILCISGSLAIVLHAPAERPLTSVLHIWQLALQPWFLMYAAVALCITLYLVYRVPQEVQTSNVFVYVAICSIVGSLSVVSCKALGIALKLTFEGDNQLIFPPTYLFLAVVACCVVTQMNYLNKALDLFNTAIVTPIYYVMFTTATIAASMIMFREEQSTAQIATEVSGFVTIICGTFLLHATKDLDVPLAAFVQLTKSGAGSAARGLKSSGDSGEVELGREEDKSSGGARAAHTALKRETSGVAGMWTEGRL